MSNELKELSIEEVAGRISNGFVSNLVANLMLIKGEVKGFKIEKITMLCNIMRQEGYELGRKSFAAPSAANGAELPEPVAHLRFRAAQGWSGNGNHDVECNEWLEVCNLYDFGDDKLPAFSVYTDEQLRAAVLAERAACAAIADSVNNHDNPMTAGDVADAIRART